jgi:hypothetical protein
MEACNAYFKFLDHVKNQFMSRWTSSACSLSVGRAFYVLNGGWVKEEDKEIESTKKKKQIDFNYNYIY